jgi:methylmalonyl-CoA/ethylmalonyl-CoA epimerase
MEVSFDHIAIAVPCMADVTPFLVGALGGAPAFGADSRFYRFGQWAFAGGGRLEILEPIGADGFLHRFLAERGPGVHHVTFKVKSLRAACDRAEARGYAIVGYNDANPAWKEAFLHPRQAMGIVVQLAEASVPPPDDFGRRWVAPPGPSNPPPPVTVVGLRLRARSAEGAAVQWGEILGGHETGTARGELQYTWPGSPLRLLVEIEPAADEGPVSIEVASDRPLALPPGRHPVLGAVFADGAPASRRR